MRKLPSRNLLVDFSPFPAIPIKAFWIAKGDSFVNGKSSDVDDIIRNRGKFESFRKISLSESESLSLGLFLLFWFWFVCIERRLNDEGNSWSLWESPLARERAMDVRLLLSISDGVHQPGAALYTARLPTFATVNTNSHSAREHVRSTVGLGIFKEVVSSDSTEKKGSVKVRLL